jgi:hypothetical protein
LELIAQQNAELEALRQQLQVQASVSTPAAPAEDIVQNEVVQKLLSEKEELLRGKEMELEQLRQHMDQLEHAQKEVPSIVVNDGQGDAPTHDEEIQKLLSEKEQLLESKERELEEMRHKFEIEIAEAAKPALAEVQEQLELLKSQVRMSFFYFFNDGMEIDSIPKQ